MLQLETTKVARNIPAWLEVDLKRNVESGSAQLRPLPPYMRSRQRKPRLLQCVDVASTSFSAVCTVSWAIALSLSFLGQWLVPPLCCLLKVEVLEVAAACLPRLCALACHLWLANELAIVTGSHSSLLS